MGLGWRGAGSSEVYIVRMIRRVRMELVVSILLVVLCKLLLEDGRLGNLDRTGTSLMLRGST